MKTIDNKFETGEECEQKCKEINQGEAGEF